MTAGGEGRKQNARLREQREGEIKGEREGKALEAHVAMSSGRQGCRTLMPSRSREREREEEKRTWR